MRFRRPSVLGLTTKLYRLFKEELGCRAGSRRPYFLLEKLVRPGAAGVVCELPNARRSTSMSRARREHENKRDCIDCRAVLCRSRSVLRCRRIYGQLEAERGQVEARRRAKERLGCL